MHIVNLICPFLFFLEMNVEYYGVFWIYAANCFVGSAFVYFVLPETKGKTLAEIEKHFAS